MNTDTKHTLNNDLETAARHLAAGLMPSRAVGTHDLADVLLENVALSHGSEISKAWKLAELAETLAVLTKRVANAAEDAANGEAYHAGRDDQHRIEARYEALAGECRHLAGPIANRLPHLRAAIVEAFRA